MPATVSTPNDKPKKDKATTPRERTPLQQARDKVASTASAASEARQEASRS